MPPFSPDRLRSGLELLRRAYEAKGAKVSDALLPPLNEGQLRAECSWFPSVLPPQLVTLYGWHNGQRRGGWEEPHPFWFRDCVFSSIDTAKAEYSSMMSTYGRPEYVTPQIDLRTCFPFAAFNGGWYVLPCHGQHLDERFPFPIISVFQGVSIFYYSMEAMVETCADWVSQPYYPDQSKESAEKNLAIWRKHNPGIFSEFRS